MRFEIVSDIEDIEIIAVGNSIHVLKRFANNMVTAVGEN